MVRKVRRVESATEIDVSVVVQSARPTRFIYKDQVSEVRLFRVKNMILDWRDVNSDKGADIGYLPVSSATPWLTPRLRQTNPI